MAGNDGRTLTGTFQKVLSMRSSGIPIQRIYIRSCPGENSLKNSESEDSVISIIIFYNIHVWYSDNKYINM